MFTVIHIIKLSSHRSAWWKSNLRRKDSAHNVSPEVQKLGQNKNEKRQFKYVSEKNNKIQENNIEAPRLQPHHSSVGPVQIARRNNHKGIPLGVIVDPKANTEKDQYQGVGKKGNTTTHVGQHHFNVGKLQNVSVDNNHTSNLLRVMDERKANYDKGQYQRVVEKNNTMMENKISVIRVEPHHIKQGKLQNVSGDNNHTDSPLGAMDDPRMNYASINCSNGTTCGTFRDLMSSWPAFKPKAAIYMLVGGFRSSGAAIVTQLRSIFKIFNDQFQYPVIIFHEEGFKKDVIRASFHRPLIFYEQVSLLQPKTLPKVDGKIKCLRKHDLGYRNMCRFQAGLVFTHPIMQGLEYVMRVDSDAELLPPRIMYDLFDFMKHHNLTYGYKTFTMDAKGCVKNLWSNVTLYAATKHIQPSFLKCWPPRQNFYNNFDISRLSFWTSRQYKDYFAYIDNLGGIYKYRWGDSPIKGLALSLFAPVDSVHIFEHIGYRHDVYKYKGYIEKYPQPKPLNKVLSCSNDTKIWAFKKLIMCSTKTLIQISYQWPLLLTWFNFNPSMDM